MRRGPCYDVGCRIQEPVTGASLPANFAMPVAVPSTPGDDAGLAVRARGLLPCLWEDEDWLADLRRESLPGSLLAGGTIAAAAAADHAHRQERALNAEVTALCPAVTGALFLVLGYDPVPSPWSSICLASLYQARHPAAGLGGPGLLSLFEFVRGGPRPAAARSGHDAARDDIPRRPGRDRVRPGAHPDRRHHPGIVQRPAARGGVRHPLSGREAAAEARGAAALRHPPVEEPPSSAATSTGRTPWQTCFRDAFGPGQLSLADRGFFSMDRWLRYSGTGAHLLWRVKNGREVQSLSRLLTR